MIEKNPVKINDASKEPRMSGLATDLYQLTMAAAYLANNRDCRASFELFARWLPPGRSYLLTAGLEQALQYLRDLSFSAEEIDYLRDLPAFAGVSEDFFAYLRRFRFSGDVWAMPEGTLAFAGEPLLRVTAPIVEAQIVETFGSLGTRVVRPISWASESEQTIAFQIET